MHIIWKTIFIVVPATAFITRISASHGTGSDSYVYGLGIGAAAVLTAFVGTAFGFEILLRRKEPGKAFDGLRMAKSFGIACGIWFMIGVILTSIRIIK